ncbi:hypothetical protein DFQ26_009578 [Actinomortierella ambigua]|nr:hypothetical protein DFQ26_009578 [Actinomortierella ambigua]
MVAPQIEANGKTLTSPSQPHLTTTPLQPTPRVNPTSHPQPAMTVDATAGVQLSVAQGIPSQPSLSVSKQPAANSPAPAPASNVTASVISCLPSTAAPTTDTSMVQLKLITKDLAPPTPSTESVALTPELMKEVKAILEDKPGKSDIASFQDITKMENEAEALFGEVIEGQTSVNSWIRGGNLDWNHWKYIRQVTGVLVLKALVWLLTRHGCVYMTGKLILELYKQVYNSDVDPQALLSLLKWSQINPYVETKTVTKERGAVFVYYRARPETLRKLVKAADAGKSLHLQRDPVQAVPEHDGLEFDSIDIARFGQLAKSMVSEDILDIIAGIHCSQMFTSYHGFRHLRPKRLLGPFSRYAPFAPLMDFFAANVRVFGKKSINPNPSWIFLESGDTKIIRPEGQDYPDFVLVDEDEDVDMDIEDEDNTSQITQSPPITNGIVDDQPNTDGTIQSTVEERQPSQNTTTTTTITTTQSVAKDNAQRIGVTKVSSQHHTQAFGELLCKHVVPPSASSRFPSLPRPTLPPPSNPSRYYRPIPDMIRIN